MLLIFYLWCRPANFRFYTKYSAEFGVLGKKLGFVETQVFSQNDSDIGVNIRKDISDKFDTQMVCNIELNFCRSQQLQHLSSILQPERSEHLGGLKVALGQPMAGAIVRVDFRGGPKKNQGNKIELKITKDIAHKVAYESIAIFKTIFKRISGVNH